VWKTDATSHTLGSTQAGPMWGRGRSHDTERSDALPTSSSLTLSTGGTSVPIETTLLDEEVEEEKEEDDEDDEQEGGSGRGDRAEVEEEVGREWVDITNLGTNEESD